MSIVENKPGSSPAERDIKKVDSVPAVVYEAYKVGDEEFPQTLIGTTIRTGNAVLQLIRSGQYSWKQFIKSDFDSVQLGDQVDEVIRKHAYFGINAKPEGHAGEGERAFPLSRFNEVYQGTKVCVRSAVEAFIDPAESLTFDGEHPQFDVVEDLFATAENALDKAPLKLLKARHKYELNFKMKGTPSRTMTSEEKYLLIMKVKHPLEREIYERGESHNISTQTLTSFINSLVVVDIPPLDSVGHEKQ